MFVWPPKSHQKQDFQEPCAALYTYTYANGRSRLLLVYSVLSHVHDLPRTQSSEHETDSMCSQSSEPSKQHIFEENTEHRL